MNKKSIQALQEHNSGTKKKIIYTAQTAFKVVGDKT